MPDSAFARVDFDEGHTRWDVLGTGAGLAFRVIAERDVEAWQGGHPSDSDDKGVAASVWTAPLRSMSGLTVQVVESDVGGGFSNGDAPPTITGVWTASFASRTEALVVDTTGPLENASSYEHAQLLTAALTAAIRS
ncbi:hypothetical protein GCM10027425_12490 [Alteromonas gracilis]